MIEFSLDLYLSDKPLLLSVSNICPAQFLKSDDFFIFHSDGTINCSEPAGVDLRAFSITGHRFVLVFRPGQLFLKIHNLFALH